MPRDSRIAMTRMGWSTVLLMQGLHIIAAIFPPPDRGGIPPETNVVNAFTPTHAVIGEGPYYISPVCSTVMTDGHSYEPPSTGLTCAARNSGGTWSVSHTPLSAW